MKLTNNQEIWLKALQSGEYEQTRGCLSDEIGFCCLGVACVLYEEDTGIKLPRNEFRKDKYDNNSLLGNLGFTDVFDWLGLKDQIAENMLIKLNDGYSTDSEHIKPHTFKEIAKKALSNPSLYFKEKEIYDNYTRNTQT